MVWVSVFEKNDVRTVGELEWLWVRDFKMLNIGLSKFREMQNVHCQIFWGVEPQAVDDRLGSYTPRDHWGTGQSFHVPCRSFPHEHNRDEDNSGDGEPSASGTKYDISGGQLTDARLVLHRPRSSPPAPCTSAGTSPVPTAIQPAAAALAGGDVEMKTPRGMISLTHEQLREQEQRVRDAGRKMGGWYLDVSVYLGLFGLLDDTHRWGQDVWSGLVYLFHMKYQHSDRLSKEGILMIGWFRAPIHFSKDNSNLEVKPEDFKDYPACFVVTLEETVTMACEQILLNNGPPWYVHRSRMIHAREVQQGDLDMLKHVHVEDRELWR